MNTKRDDKNVCAFAFAVLMFFECGTRNTVLYHQKSEWYKGIVQKYTAIKTRTVEIGAFSRKWSLHPEYPLCYANTIFFLFFD